METNARCDAPRGLNCTCRKLEHRSRRRAVHLRTLVERTVTLHNETGSATTKSVLSAETRAGLAADVEYDFNKVFGTRLELSWIDSPLRIKSTSGDQGTSIDAGHVNATTFVFPVVFHLASGP